MLGKEYIVSLLKSNDKAIGRALLVLNDRQTQDEQASENTRYLNGMGFRPCHARMGTSMAKFFKRNGYLSPKQIAYWRATDRTGAMRIGIYWRQLAEAAEQKKAETKPVAEAPVKVEPEVIARDLGNDMERKLQLEYELGMVMDSDDPKLIEPIAKEISEIDAFWAEIQKMRNN